MLQMNAASMNTDSATSPAADHPLHPPLDLAEPILAISARLAAASSLWRLSAIALPLNVLARTHAPLVTKAAIMELPHIDLTWATHHADIALLEFMIQWSKQPRGRPLNYDASGVLPAALRRDSPEVLDWWLGQTGLFVNWDWGAFELLEAFLGKEEGDLRWFEWWKARGFPFLEENPNDGDTLLYLAVEASRYGRVDILNWLLEHVPKGAERLNLGETLHGNAIQIATQGGHVVVLDWWVAKVDAGALRTTIDWMGVLSKGFQCGHLGVLEWCKNQVKMMGAWLQEMRQPVRPTWFFETMCLSAIQNRLVDWFETFDLLPFGLECANVSIGVCAQGYLDLVKQLYHKGHLVGSRKDLIQVSLPSGNVELLDWIQSTIDPSIPDSTDEWFGYDPFHSACQSQGVEMLDWLVANGYKFPEPGSLQYRVFHSAVDGKRFDALEWMFKHGYANGMSMVDWGGCFEAASNNGHLEILDFLFEKVSKVSPSEEYQASALLETHMLYESFAEGQMEVLDWWLSKSGWLKNVFDLNHDRPYFAAFSADGGALQLAMLKAWFQAGQQFHVADCIHEASIRGRVDVLDWFLNSTSASEQDFANAWSSEDFPDEVMAGNRSAHSWFDSKNHGRSLIWWCTNLPHICKILPVNRGPYENPIHAHLFKHRLKNPSFELQTPYYAVEAFDGHVALLEYRKQHGDVKELEEDGGRCLHEASEYGRCHVLDWWQASGLKMEWPEAEIYRWETVIPKRVKQWWAKSGLVDQEQLGKMRTEY